MAIGIPAKCGNRIFGRRDVVTVFAIIALNCVDAHDEQQITRNFFFWLVGRDKWAAGMDAAT
jgi:hypothetical protein